MSVENPLSDPLKPPPEAPRNFGFNWGALGLGAGWLFGHGKVYLGAGFILLYYFFKLLQFPLPLIILFFLPIHIFFAFTGNKIAWKYHHVESKADVRRGGAGGPSGESSRRCLRPSRSTWG